MKNELIDKLRALVEVEEITSARESVRDIRNEWKAESAKERQEQLEAFRAQEQPEGEPVEFVYVPNELESQFQDLLKRYEDRVQEHGRKLAAERQQNLEAKMALVDEFEKLIQEEQNVGKAFSSQKLIRERWDAIGDVPGDKYADVMDRWQKLNHAFFYHINIYKSLQDHDLKINQRKKEELIEEAKKLSSVEQIADLEIMVRRYDREWKSIGPCPREVYEQLGDTFFGILRESQKRIQDHYDEIHRHSDENLAKKQALVQRMSEILTMEITNLSTWNRWTDDVLKLQEEWRTIGWARKKDNEEVWQSFRGLCDLFFSKRKAFFEEKRGSYKDNKDKKEALIERARVIQNSEDWKTATEEIKAIQAEWKKVGNADPRDEQKLWLRFRSMCDHFFARKKENYAKISGEQSQNLVLKEDILRELEALELTGNKGTDIAALRAIGDKWHAVGFVPKDKLKEVMDRYNALLDQKYGKINAEREEREMSNFRNRLETIRTGSDGEHKMKREKNFMRDKIEKLRRDIQQYQNNMGIFTGKGAESLRKDIEKKIKSAEREIEDIKRKMQMLG
ncbi:MAG: DUF349 domain-containing protein [Flavobacteriales bacterium]